MAGHLNPDMLHKQTSNKQEIEKRKRKKTELICLIFFDVGVMRRMYGRGGRNAADKHLNAVLS